MAPAIISWPPGNCRRVKDGGKSPLLLIRFVPVGPVVSPNPMGLRWYPNSGKASLTLSFSAPTPGG